MNKSWFLSCLFDFFEGFANRNRKKYTKRGAKEERGKVWRNIKKKRSTMQRDSLISFYAFYLFVLASIGDRCSHRYLYIYRVFGFVLFNLSACGPERIVASSPLFFIHLSFVLYSSARLLFYLSRKMEK